MHISRTYGSFPIILKILPRYAFFSTACLHCTFVSGFSPLAFRELLKHIWHKLVVYDSAPSFIPTDANCQWLSDFSLHCLSQRNIIFCGTLTALGAKSLLPAPHSLLLLRNPAFLLIPLESLSFSNFQISAPSSPGTSLSLLDFFASACSRWLLPSKYT